MKGVIDELVKETIDPLTGENLGCWNTTNTEQESENTESEDVLFDLKAQGINHDIIVNFIDIVESKKLHLLVKKQDSNYDVEDIDFFRNHVAPHIQTDLFIEEVANIKLKTLPSGKFTVERLIKGINKDRYTAVAYGCYYIMTYEDNIQSEEAFDLGMIFN